MADEEPEPTTAEEDAPKGKKMKLVLAGGGTVTLVALAYMASLMGVPKVTEPSVFGGPFVAPLTSEKITVNLSEEANKRFIVMNLTVMFDAYDEAYHELRSNDPLYMAELKDALLGLASTKSRTQVLGKDAKLVFLEEVRQEVEPLLFPVHVGEGERPTDVDPESGLAAGLSIRNSTFRGPFEEHVLQLDADGKTVALDDGAPVSYVGDETDLEVLGQDGKILFVDVTRVVDGFVGPVRVGVRGRLRRVLWDEVLVQ